MSRLEIPEHIRRNPPTVILGQPGSGKTHELVKQAKNFMSGGYFAVGSESYLAEVESKPRHDMVRRIFGYDAVIGKSLSFISYTKPGVEAGRSRLGIPEYDKGKNEQGAFVGTLHAICHRHANLGGRTFVPYVSSTKAVSCNPDLNPDDILDVRRVLEGYKGPSAYIEPGKSILDLSKKTEYSYLRNTLQSIKPHKAYVEALEKVKLADFTELLVLALDLGWVIGERELEYLPVDYLFIDEAQDLTPLMWSIVFKRFRPTAGLCIAGDPRQALYVHQGVDRNIFLDLVQLSLDAGRVIHQPICYRVPEKVYSFASHVAKGFDDESFWSSAGLFPKTVRPGGFFSHIMDSNQLRAFFDMVSRYIKDHITVGLETSVSLNNVKTPVIGDIFLAYISTDNKGCRSAFMPIARHGICPVITGDKGGLSWMWNPNYVKRYLEIFKLDGVRTLSSIDKKIVGYIYNRKDSRISGKAFTKFLDVLIASPDKDYALKFAYNRICPFLVSTVYKVKGLEFPWTILQWNRGKPGNDIDYLSAFYVGVTRCLEGLLIHRDVYMRDPGIPLDGWIKDSVWFDVDDEEHFGAFKSVLDAVNVSLKAHISKRVS